jgi:DNA-binding NarL/FixJ family response regulator
MSDEIYRLLLVDADRIFRMGMRTWLAQFPDLEVVAEMDTLVDTLEILQGESDLDLVILDLDLGLKNLESSKTSRQSGLELCQSLKSRYPKLPILLLSSPQAPELVKTALLNGIEGYCLKRTSPDELITAIRLVASGNRYFCDRNWLSIDRTDQTTRLSQNFPEQTVVAIVKRHFYLSGIRKIDLVLNEVKANLADTNHDQIRDRIAKMVLAGQARELQAARWLVDRLWGQKSAPVIISENTSENTAQNISEEFTSLNLENLEISDRQTDTSQNRSAEKLRSNALAVQASLWDDTVKKLQSSLLNLGKSPLEIDVLKDAKKRELLYITLRQIEKSITDLRFSQIQPLQLESRISDILKDIWQESVTNFFGKYYIISNITNLDLAVNSEVFEVNVVDILLSDIAVVKTEFLDKIPHVDNLLSHLLFGTELVVDNSSNSIGTSEAMQRGGLILDNLIIQIANAVIQPLLNNFADSEEIKQNFYRYNLLATREIERFRNDLSWKYRLEKYITDPQLIFESRHILLTLTEHGIKKVSIYTPRNHELKQLEGVQLAITLVLELQDAIAPRLKSAITFIGSGFIYVLTNVIGRGIGLIGRGVVQGIGTAWQDSRTKK